MSQAKLVLYTNKNVYLQSDSFQLVPAFIAEDGSFNMITASEVNVTIINGNNLVNLLDPSNLIYNMVATGSVNILVQYNNNHHAAVLNIQIVNAEIVLNENNIFNLIQQETPSSYNNTQYDQNGNVQGVFTDNKASAFVIADLYRIIYTAFTQIYPETLYTTSWEFALNNTTNLFNGLPMANQLLSLLYQSWVQTALNVFDLELFLTKYIYYRTNGNSVVVFIEDNSYNFRDFWILGSSELDETTVLSPYLVESNICNITIFNTLTPQLQNEINSLIMRFIRADIIYTLNFTNDNPANPPYNLNDIGYTYRLDQRLIYRKALQFTNGAYPFNLVGYN